MFKEEEVIPKILKGDLQAFSLLVKQYEQLVFYVINRLVNHTEDKEDICQEVFIKVHKNLKSFAFKSKLSTWIARIAYLTSVNYLRDHKKAVLSDYPDNLDDIYFTDENPEQLLTKKDINEYLNKLINKLPLHYKTVITLYHLNEFSYNEIEEITGMPEGTVKSYLFRARKLLKEKLETYLKNE